MKNILKTTIIAFLLLAMGSCTTDTHPVASQNGITQNPITPSGPYVLSAIGGDNDVATLSWTIANNGVETIPSTYVIEFAKAGTNFEKPIVASPSSSATTYLWKEGYLNGLLLANGFVPDLAVDIDIRIKSTLGLGSHTFIQYSNVFTKKVTPFAQPTFSLTKVGANPANAPKIISSDLFSTACEGYAWLDAGDYKFYTSVQNVFQTSNPFYGNNGSGALALNGTAINVATAGFYLIKADIGSSPTTYSVTLIEWGIFGSANIGPGSANNKPMVYNDLTKKWEIIITLAGGKPFRFRNTVKTLILGAFDATRVGVDYAGATMSYNVSVPGVLDNKQPGNITLPGTTPTKYKISLDLNTPRAYSYTLEVQQP